MSAEEETTGSAPQDASGETPAKEPAAKKPKPAAKAKAEKTEAKAPAAKKPAAKKPAAKRAPAGKEAEAKTPAPSKESTAAKEPATPGKQPAPRAAKGAAKAPRRRIVRAHARYVRTSARKARMVCGHLRGKSVQEARAILAFTPREVARDWSKLLEDDLIVREAYADEGPTIKRFRPRAMGRATPIRKRTSHLTITLTTGSQTRTTKRQS